MSGHSHFATIKHKKGLADAQRSKAFSKLAREITLAAKGGADPASNSALRAILEKAKEINMPRDSVERSIKKATGEGSEGNLQEFLFEAYGPGGVAMLISGITDNKNRTLGEIKLILSKFGGKMVEGGAVQWMFEQKGEFMLTLSPPQIKENLELIAIEAGAQDTSWQDDATLLVYTAPANLEAVKADLLQKNLKAEHPSLSWVAKEYVEATPDIKEAAQKLFEALDEQDDVQGVYSNL